MHIIHNPHKWSIGSNIRLPKEIIEKQTNFSLDQPLNVIIKNKSVVLTPFTKKKTITLETLLTDVTPEDVGGEFILGKVTGREVYE